MESFLNVPLTITVKMDGSNVGISFDTVSSRSGNIDQHPSFDMLKQKHAIIKYDIPENMIFYGE
ncbi:MAG: RNA ligase family protein [Elusimicrobiota bacterium]